MASSQKPRSIRFVLDRTGSMAEWEAPVVDGVNAYLEKMKRDPVARNTPLSLVQFDSMGFDILRQGLIDEIKPLSKEEYKPRALTPLLDAVGAALLDNVDEGTQYTIVIFTDGLENASQKFILDEIKMLIERRRKEGWIVIFLGANFDAWEVAKSMGIPPETAMNTRLHGTSSASQQNQARASGTGSSTISPIVLALGAAAALGLAYWALRPGSANAAEPSFSDADRNEAMGVDGVSKTWQDAVKEDIAGFDEPFASVLDLPQELQQASAELPADFDPSLGSMVDGAQAGGFHYSGEVIDSEDLALLQGVSDDAPEESGGDDPDEDAPEGDGGDGPDDGGDATDAIEAAGDATEETGSVLGDAVEGLGEIVSSVLDT